MIRAAIPALSAPLRPLKRLVLAAFCLLLPVVCQAAPLVAASIKPLQHIAAAITDGISEVALVLDSSQDPHHISLRPSERRLLQEADVLLWIGPALELPLQRLVGQSRNSVITAQTLPAVSLLDPGAHPDPHLWLDTGNALAIATALGDTLAILDPANAGRYQHNQQAFARLLQQLDVELQALFGPHQGDAWAVEHDAFAYIGRQSGLAVPLQLKGSDNQMPGLRSVNAFTSAMRAEGLDCIVVEPDANVASLRTLLGHPALRVASIDIMGFALAVDASSYAGMLREAAQALASCMSEAHE
jgi:zinc transport system substrate-binding protein